MSLPHRLDDKLLLKSEVQDNFDALEAEFNLGVGPGIVLPDAINYRHLQQAPYFPISRKFGDLPYGIPLTFTATAAPWFVVDQSIVAHTSQLPTATDRGVSQRPTVQIVARLYYAGVGSLFTGITKAALAYSNNGGATWTPLTAAPSTRRFFGLSSGRVTAALNGAAPVFNAMPQTDFLTGAATYIPVNTPQDRPVTLVASFAVGVAQGTPVPHTHYCVITDQQDTTSRLLSGEIWLTARDTAF